MDFEIPKKIIKTETVSAVKPYRFSIVETFLLIVVIGLFSWFILLPKKAAVQTRENELKDLVNQQQSIASKVSTLKGLIAQLESHQKQVSYLDEALPLEGRTSKLQILLNSITASAGVTVGDMNIMSDSEQVFATNTDTAQESFKASRSLKKLTANVYVIGTYEQLKAFLEKVEETGRILDIVSLDLGASQDNQLDLRLVVTSYYYAP